MNYEKIYNQLVDKCKPRGLDKKSVDYYTEIHHIVARCLGGGNEESNLVMFSAREHFVAHLLLWKANPEHKGLAVAVMLMADTKNFKINSHQYKVLKELCRQHNIERMENYFKDITGSVFGRLTVIENVGWVQRNSSRLSKWLCKCECGNFIELPSNTISSGNTRSCGCLSVEYRNSVVGELNPFYGKLHSTETKSKISKARLERDIKPWEIGLAQNPKDLLRWALSDIHYELWLTFDKPSRRKLRIIYNEIYCDDLHQDYFRGSVEKFKEGWIPKEDSKWLKFSTEYLG